MRGKKKKKVDRKMIKTGIVGVYSRPFTGDNGKPDQCFYIAFRNAQKKQVLEKVGLASEGYGARMAGNIRGDRIRAIRHGQELPREKAKIPFFSEAIKFYSEWAETNKGDKNDQARWENHLKPFLEKKRLNEISPFDLERIKAELFKKDLAPATVRHCLQLIRATYNKMISWGKYSGANPTRKVSFPTLNNRRERFLSVEEIQALLGKLKAGSRSTYEIALVSLHTGLRAGEIFNIRRQDVDLENGVIRVMDPKNKNPRAAYLTPEVKEILRARLPANPGDLVFLPRIHAKGQISRVSGFFQRTADDMFNKGIEDRRQKVVFYTLRHTFASWLAIDGTPLHVIKDLLGHKTLSMTERYVHLIPSIKQEATRAIGAKFSEVKTRASVLEFPR